MVKKRIIGTVTVIKNLAVQSIGYSKYLPLGKPEVLVENLDRWSVDEIIVNCPDRSRMNLGPNFQVLESIVQMGISTPLIYSGGIRHLEDVIKILKLGTDRICIDNLAQNNKEECKKISRAVGNQAVIAALPLRIENETLMHYHYLKQEEKKIDHSDIENMLSDWASEILVIDWKNEGKDASFDQRLVEKILVKQKKFIVFGGISKVIQIRELLRQDKVSAVAIGNSLTYTEHAIYNLKSNLKLSNLRDTKWN